MEYQSDLPLSDPLKDRFQRYPFALTIAQSILSRKDQSPLVIGVNGSWGEGKSTVLDFIDGIIRKDLRYTIVRFNPWRYAAEEVLLKQFFESLALAIKSREPITFWGHVWRRKALETHHESLFRRILPAANATKSLVPYGLADVVTEIGLKFSTVELEALKARFNKMLNESGQKLIIIIDDIDRLEDDEVHSIFRLVKLTADFSNTTYILSFDETVIAKVVSKRYTAGEAGGSFLEKIIQVPLKLPPALESDLQAFCLEGIDKILNSKEILLSSSEQKNFSQRFTLGILPLLKTPRMAIRYWNALNYSLDMLKGEVNMVDLFTIEALKIFTPDIYEFVRTHKDVVIGNPLSTTNNREGIEKVRKKLKQLLENDNLTIASPLNFLLKDTFPLVKNLYQKDSQFNEIELKDDSLANKSIASPYYFDRYFALVVLKNQISDLDLADLLLNGNENSVEHSLVEWNRLISINTIELMLKLITKQNELSYKQVKMVINFIGQSSKSFSSHGFVGLVGSEVSQASILVKQLIRRFRNEKDIVEVLNNFVRENSSMDFVIDFIGYLYPDIDRVDVFPDKNLVDKLTQYWVDENIKQSHNEPIFVTSPNKSFKVLITWSELGNKDLVEQYIKKFLNSNPQYVFDLLKAFTPFYTHTTTGKSGFGDFDRDSYNQLGKVINNNFLFTYINHHFFSITNTFALFSGKGINLNQDKENIMRQYVHWELKEQADV